MNPDLCDIGSFVKTYAPKLVEAIKMTTPTWKEYLRAKDGVETTAMAIRAVSSSYRWQQRPEEQAKLLEYHREALKMYQAIVDAYPLRRSDRMRCHTLRAHELYRDLSGRKRNWFKERHFVIAYGNFQPRSMLATVRKHADKALFAH